MRSIYDSKMTPLLFVGSAWLFVIIPSTRAAEHPRLVNLESTDCQVCHEDLLDKKEYVHPPVEEDCSVCHEFDTTGEQTTVTLMEQEPGLCIMCHDDLEKAWLQELEAPHMAVEDSCLACHDPHASEQPRMKLASTRELCANCHDVADLSEIHGNQLSESTDCASCHQPHGSDNPGMLVGKHQHAPFADGACTGCHRQLLGDRVRLRTRGSRLCVACHGEFPVIEGGSVHAALEDEGARASCLKCHNPHMSAQQSLLIEAGPTLCATCHQDVVEGALAGTGHAPAADDCTACHQPHTAEHPQLLSTASGDVCGECHDLSDEDLASAHLQADLAALVCTSCHSPHGAGNPKILQASLHPPIEDGCDLCHEGTASQLAEGGGADLCLMCHDDIGEIAAASAVSHAAMEMEDCTLCHNPHASAQRKLVKLPSGGACAECHSEQAAGPGEVAHGVIDLIGCEACHEPHGGSAEKLLRASGSELCLECHGPDSPAASAAGEEVLLLGHFQIAESDAADLTVLTLSADLQQDHPFTGHRVLGVPTEEEIGNTETEFTGELTCSTCHNPHKGRSRHLFNWDAANPTEVCQNCHVK